MALKRKASFSAIASPNALVTAPGELMMIDETPKHLNSRTRKRFRNDRPDDEVVYENTLRWLFSAQQQQQQQQQQSTYPTDEDMNTEHLPSPETIDSRQQTLHKFFQPAQSSFFRSKASNLTSQKTDCSSSPLAKDAVMPRHTTFNMNLAALSSVATSETNSSTNCPQSDGGMGSKMDIVNN